jgi:hypothetical protein
MNKKEIFEFLFSMLCLDDAETFEWLYKKDLAVLLSFKIGQPCT